MIMMIVICEIFIHFSCHTQTGLLQNNKNLLVVSRIIPTTPKDVHILITGNWIYYLTEQKGIKVADRIKVANSFP